MNTQLQVNIQPIIQGSTESDSNYPSVCKVLLTSIYGLEYTCTGTLISPDLVLCAAHCVDAPRIHSAVCVFKGERYEAAKRWFWSKDFNQDTIESNTTELKRLKSVELDFTLLQLNTPVLDIAPSPMMPLAEFRKLVKNGSVKSLKAVGFGRFSKFETSDLLAGSAKRSASFTRFSFPKYTDTIKVYPTKIVKKEPVSIAVGDSGGPYFTRYRNVNYIVATVSTITYNHQGDSSFATALSVDSVIEFFKSTVFQQFTQSIGPLGYGYVKPFERKLDLDRAKKINIDENQCIHGYCVREKPLLFAALAVVPITLYTYLGCKVFNVK